MVAVGSQVEWSSRVPSRVLRDSPPKFWDLDVFLSHARWSCSNRVSPVLTVVSNYLNCSVLRGTFERCTNKLSRSNELSCPNGLGLFECNTWSNIPKSYELIFLHFNNYSFNPHICYLYIFTNLNFLRVYYYTFLEKIFKIWGLLYIWLGYYSNPCLKNDGMEALMIITPWFQFEFTPWL